MRAVKANHQPQRAQIVRTREKFKIGFLLPVKVRQHFLAE